MSQRSANRSAPYTLDYDGWRNASDDATDMVTQTPVEPERVDLSSYRLVFLGSPIWWHRPAPPLWAFVGHNDFTGTSVVLFNTFNTRFVDENIELFRQAVQSQGGQMIDHFHIRRGSSAWQLDRDELVQEVREGLEAKAETWLTRAGEASTEPDTSQPP